MPTAPTKVRVAAPSRPVQEMIAAAALLAFFTWFRVRMDEHIVARSGEYLDADFWPGILLSLGMLLSAVLLLTSIVKWRKAAAQETDTLAAEGESADAEPTDTGAANAPSSAMGSGWKMLGGVVSVLGYAYLLRPVGFVVTTALFCIVFLALQRVRSWLWYIAIPIGVNAVVLVVFTRVLQSPLPQGRGFFAQISQFLY